MCEQKFFRCKHCGNLVGLINDGKMPMICCGNPMEKLTPNTVEASAEKHIPEIYIDNALVHVKVGSMPHPMTAEHYIEFLYLQTENGGQIRHLKAGGEAAAVFAVLEEKPLAVFAYCNLHGLWKIEVPCDCRCEQTEAEAEPVETACSAEFSQGCK